MWGDEDKPYTGRHYRLERTLNSPQSLSRPHPPILIGGSGERKTLRLVAQYAQACNLFPGPELEHKLDVLRRHCDAVGRDYDEIEKTVMGPLDPGPDGERAGDLIREMGRLGSLGVQHYHGSVPDAASLRRIEVLGQQVIPEVTEL